MPRVSINKKKYMLSDFSEWVVGRMKKMGYTQKQMGEKIGVGQSSYSEKLNKNNFSLSDAMTIMKELCATDEEILRLMKL